MKLELKALNKDDIIININEKHFNNSLIKLGWMPPDDNKIEMKLYQEYEFCKAKKCHSFKNKCCNDSCIYTAKEFHNWLKENNFKLIKLI